LDAATWLHKVQVIEVFVNPNLDAGSNVEIYEGFDLEFPFSDF